MGRGPLQVDVHKKIEPTDVILSSSHGKKITFLYQNLFFWRNRKLKLFFSINQIVVLKKLGLLSYFSWISVLGSGGHYASCFKRVVIFMLAAYGRLQGEGSGSCGQGRGQNLDFLVDIINGWPLTFTHAPHYPRYLNWSIVNCIIFIVCLFLYFRVKGSLHNDVTLGDEWVTRKHDKTWWGWVGSAERDVMPKLNYWYEFSNCCCLTNQSRIRCLQKMNTALPILIETVEDVRTCSGSLRYHQ